MICPNKNLKEYKALENAVGELEAFRVFDAYDNDIPVVFGNPGLTNADITSIANTYTGRQTPVDITRATNKINSLLTKVDALSTEGMELAALKQSLEARVPVQKGQEQYESSESKQVSREKIDVLSKTFGVKVVEDPSIKAYAQVDPYKAGEVPTMRVNFNHGGLRKDTVIHEFGHIYIDLLGGMDNEMVKTGRRHLQGSEIEAQILADPEYAGLDQATIDKEILATALGRKGSDIYDMQGRPLERFKNWLTMFYNKLKKAIGLDYDAAFMLANQMLNEQIKLGDAVGIGSEVAQKQVLPGTVTPEQEATLQGVIAHSNAVSMTDNQKHYKVAHIEGLLQRTSNRMDMIYPESKFPEERRKYYEASRQWGNINDLIWNEVANGKTYEEVMEVLAEEKSLNEEMAKYSLSETAMRKIYTYADNWVKDMVGQGYVVLSQQAIYSEDTMVAGTTDIMAISPQGTILIMDNKSSTNPTEIGTSYGKLDPNTGEGEWNYYDRGFLESYYTKHTKQQSAYQKMYEDLGFTVDHLFIQPVNWAQVSEDRLDIEDVNIEPLIPLIYNPTYGQAIIDNAQARGKKLFTTDEIVEEELDQMMQRVNERVRIVMAKYQRSKSKENWYAEMQILAQQMELGSNLSSLTEFVKQGISRVQWTLEQFEKIKKNSNYSNEVINTYKEFANTFNIVDDVLKFAANAEVMLDSKESPQAVRARHAEELKVDMTPEEEAAVKSRHKEELLSAKQDRFTSIYLKRARKDLEKLSRQVLKVNNIYTGIAKERMALRLAGVSKWGLEKFKQDTMAKWKKENPRENTNLSRAAWNQLGKEYVNEQVAANKTLIATMNYNRMKELLTEAPSDIDSLSMWVVDQKNLDDGIIQVAEKMLSRADYGAMRAFTEAVQTTEPVYQAFVEAKGGSETDYDTLYEDLYEIVDGKSTGNLVGKYKASYKKAENEWYTANKKRGYNPTFEERQAFYDKLRAEHINPQWEKLMAMDDSNPIKAMYNHLHEMFEKTDEMLPSTHSLAIYYSDGYDEEENTNIMWKQYRLPSIEKSTIARLKQQGVFKTAGAGIADMLKRDTETTESGEQQLDEEGKVATKKFKVKESVKKILVDERNREAKFVPIHYRGKVDDGQQSLDLMSIAMIDHNMALNYHAKSHLAPEMEMLRDVLEERKVVQTDSAGNAILNAVKGGMRWSQSNKELASNSYKAFVSIMDDRLYGISSIDLGEITLFGKEVNVNKLTGAIMGWTGDTFLMLNYMAAGTGFLQGNIMNWMEAVGGTDISKKSLAKAEAMYLGVGYPSIAAGIVNDIGKRRPTGLVGLLAERFNARSDFRGLHARYGTNTAINMANKGTLHSLQDMQEHFVQGTLMMGILLDQTVTDKDGKNEIPMMEAYEVTEDGFLKVKEGYEDSITEDLEFEMSARIREVGKQAHGNYDNNNKAMIQRYAMGKLVFMLRKWLVTGVQKRYRGLVSRGLTPGIEEVKKKDKFFSESLGRFEEGMYTTAILFLRTIRKESKFLSMRAVSKELDNLTEEERANLKRVVFEVGSMVASFLAQATLAGLAKGEKDPEKRKRLYLMALYARRLYSELTFYWNVPEGFKIMRSPMATMSIVEKIFRLFIQLGEDAAHLEFERYERGPRKGEAKAKKRLYSVIPIMGQVDREVEEMYKLLAR